MKYRPPAEGTASGITVRNDTGVYEGGEISIYYDPMIAKLVTHADTRAKAIAAQAQALDAFYIDGIRHNIPFLSALMQSPRWQEGRLSTGFIAEEFPDGFAPTAPSGALGRRIAAVAAAVDNVLGERKRRISGQMSGRAVVRDRRRSVWLGGEEVKLAVARESRGVGVRFIDEAGEETAPHLLISTWKPGDPVWHGTVDGEPVAVQVRAIRNGFLLAHRGIETTAFVYTESESAASRLMPVKVATDTGKKLLCPMPGLVVSIAVDAGAGGQGGGDARRRRSDEDGERAARRARRHRQSGVRQEGRQPRRRRGDFGVCVDARAPQSRCASFLSTRPACASSPLPVRFAHPGEGVRSPAEPRARCFAFFGALEEADRARLALSHHREQGAVRVHALDDPFVAGRFRRAMENLTAGGGRAFHRRVDVADIEVMEPQRARRVRRLPEHAADRLASDREQLARARRAGFLSGVSASRTASYRRRRRRLRRTPTARASRSRPPCPARQAAAAASAI